MQVGLNTLLRQGKPDRLLIEPTGLGHPKQILDILTAAVYEPWIDLRATVCILDPRQLLDEKVVNNDNFRDQLAAADIIVANKNDRETPESAQALADWWQRWGGDRRKVSTTQGNIDLALLDEPRRNTAPLPASAEHVHHSRPTGGLAALSLPEHQRWRRHLNSGQGYQACGWIFDAETVFGNHRPARMGTAGARGARQRRDAHCRRGREDQPPGRGLAYRDSERPPHPIAESSLSRRTKPTGTRSRPHC